MWRCRKIAIRSRCVALRLSPTTCARWQHGWFSAASPLQPWNRPGSMASRPTRYWKLPASVSAWSTQNTSSTCPDARQTCRIASGCSICTRWGCCVPHSVRRARSVPSAPSAGTAPAWWKTPAVHVQHMHKALTQMNLQIHHVLSDITGQSGMAIVEAIVAAEHDPPRLAALCHRRVRSDRQAVIKSLVGNYRSEHLFTLKQSLQAYRYCRELMAECDREIEQRIRQLTGKVHLAGKTLAPPPDPEWHKRQQKRVRLRNGPGTQSDLWRRSAASPEHQRTDFPLSCPEIGPEPQPICQRGRFRQLAGSVPRPTKRAAARSCRPKTRQSETAVHSNVLRIAAQTLARSRHPSGQLVIAVCAPGWERPRPSPPRLTNWPVLSTTC